MIIQLNLSPLTIQNLHMIRGNPSSSIEWLVRSYNTYSFPAPRIMSSRQSKQSINVQLAPYVVWILGEFAIFGLTASQVVEWLVTNYMNLLKATEPSEPKVPKIKQLRDKSKQTKQKQPTYPEKQPFVHNQNSEPIVKRAKIKPIK